MTDSERGYDDRLSLGCACWTHIPLDPQARRLLDALAALPQSDFSALSVADYRASMANAPQLAPGDEVARLSEHFIEGPGGRLRLKLYYPNEARRLPITLFFHGGGFVSCSADTHDNICRCLARRGEALVASVDYRLAPEARFPGAVEDALAALKWARSGAAEIGGDPTRIAVAGDSAGGTLAAVVAHAARLLHPLRHQLLLYPVMDCRFDTPSYQAYAQGYLLSTAMMKWFWAQYLANGKDADDPRACPLRQTELAGVAPATVVTAECDPLRDEGEQYAFKLQAAGVPTTLKRWPGQIHGFASMLGLLDAADEVLSMAGKVLRNAFGSPGIAGRPVPS